MGRSLWELQDERVALYGTAALPPMVRTGMFVLKFEKLEVWQLSAQLSAEVYMALAHLKDFGFKDQITRSCLSISSNIAEGCERSGPKDRQRFLDIAKGSAGEFISQVYIGRKVGYIKNEQGRIWQQEAAKISKMLVSLKKSWSAP